MGRSYFLGHSTFCRPPPAEPSTTAPATLPSQGSASGVTKLGMPNDVVADAAGNLLVMDTRNERVAVFRQDGTFIASIMEGFFKDKGNTFSYLACNVETGVVALSNNDMHELALLSTDPARLVVAE
ncbi:unnamed protein product [Durusdinium trenchii]|uniref:Uncharacterized protein n=1 Tax=Durusdinium trenchii TaxID=1381693 RepID=A0ABP0SV82_9DINO